LIAGVFRASEAVLAALSAASAQTALYLAFSASSPPQVQADISDENSRPFAVSITPVSASPLGDDHRAALPRSWQRRAVPRPLAQAELPSPKAERTPRTEQARREPNAAALPAKVSFADASPTVVTEPGAAASGAEGSGAPSPGVPAGSGQGGEGDVLKTRAIGLYRAELVSWFMTRFDIRGKIPFEVLKTLRAVALVSVTPDYTVGGFSLATTSGNPIFDAEVRATLAAVQSSGATLPAPPPLYVDVLGPSLSVSFQCTSRSQCE